MSAQPTATGSAAVVALRGITKRFPGVVANDGVDLELFAGETLGLLGENGAGKSVLMSVLYGRHRPDAGHIEVHGERVEFASPLDAIAVGIGMVHQHFMLVPPLSVLDNIILGAEPMNTISRIDRRAARAQIEALAARYRLAVDLDRRVEDIPVGMAQRVEILKAVYRGAKVLVLDEPTAVLTPAEVEGLHDILDALRAEGVPAIFITHKLREILSFCDRVVVMRRGRVVDTMTTAGTSQASLARAMVGRPVLLEVDKQPARPGDVVLSVRGLRTEARSGDHDLDGVDLDVRAGEIVGVAGVAGNGQTNLVGCVSGVARTAGGTIRLGGRDVTRENRAHRLAGGMSVIPEDRLSDGVIPTFPVYENAVLGDQNDRRFGRAWARDMSAVRGHARHLIERFDVRCADESVAIGSLSGGNQQKLVCGREIDRQPSLLIAAQPTRGVDVGAIEFIHSEIIRRRDDGAGVLLVSTELDEVLSLSDRVAVMYQGRVVADLDAAAVSAEEVGLYMAGGGANDD